MASALVKSPAIDPRHTSLQAGDSRVAHSPARRIHARKNPAAAQSDRVHRRAHQSPETKRRGDGPITYLFTLDNYWTIDGAFGGSGAEIINHSCDPNLYTMILKGHILYMSRRAIRAGEELTVDYRFSDEIEDVPCKCGSKHCRGTINLKE